MTFLTGEESSDKTFNDENGKKKYNSIVIFVGFEIFYNILIAIIVKYLQEAL